MKNIFVFLSVALLCGVSQSLAQQSSDSLRILTFNIYGAPNSDWPTRLGLILDEFEQIQPDIIGFQEVVETPGMGSVDNTVKIIAESLYVRTGVYYNYYWERTHFSWGTFDEGVAILSKHLMLQNDFLELPPGVFNRKVVTSNIYTPIGMIQFYNTHLSYGDQQVIRNAQAAAIKDFIIQNEVDSIASFSALTGDFNSGPDSISIQTLVVPDTNGVFFWDTWDVINPGLPGYTMPANAPTNRIDYVFMKEANWEVIYDSRQVLNTPQQGIYPSDHIGVLSIIGSSIHDAELIITTPQGGGVLSGNYSINWNFNDLIEPMELLIYFSNDNGISWTELWSGSSTVNNYLWDTTVLPDGTKYLLRFIATADSSYSMVTTPQFTINNPGNAAPEIEILAPRSGQVINEQFEIEWSAADADGDTLLIDLEVSNNNGSTWTGLAQNLLNDGSFLWNTLSYANSPFYKLKLIVSDDSVQVEAISNHFEIQNFRTLLSDSLFIHVSGDGDGGINSNVFDSTETTDHLYQIVFDDTSFSNKVYHVYDTNIDSFVVENATELNGLTEGPAFNGMRLVISDYSEALVNQAGTGWTIGNTNLEHTISIPELDIGGTVYFGFPYAADYQITIYDQFVDTSSTYLGAPETPLKFILENLTENRQIEVIFIEQDFDNTISAYDEMYLLESDSTGAPMLTWLIYFGGSPPFTDPQVGDRFIFSTLKPFDSNDIFEFSTDFNVLSLSDINKTVTKFELLQNYPNPFNPTTNIKFNLPVNGRVQLEIFNVIGEKVITLLDKYQNSGSYSIQWNGRNSDGSFVSSGVYIYRLNSVDNIHCKKMILLR